MRCDVADPYARRRTPLHRGSRRACGPLAFALIASLFACKPQSSSETVWVEDISAAGLGDNRLYAVRLSLFRYGPEIGGYAEFFGVDGACNTPQEPYFCSDYCAYFGPGAYRDGSFRIQTTAPDGSLFQAQATINGRRDLDLIITTGGDALGAGALPVRIALEPDRLGVVSRQCPTREQAAFSLPQSGHSPSLSSIVTPR